MKGRLASASVAALLLAACDPAPEGAEGCDRTVAPGADDTEALQTLFIEASAGTTICLEAGTYAIRTELSIAKPGLTVRGAGRGRTILDFSKEDVGANGLQLTADDLTIEALTVQDTPGDGIRASSVNRIAFRDVEVLWSKPASVDNGAYGLYPVGCDDVRIERSRVSGARDAGIYVGQSTHILVADSEADGNVAGIELENSNDAEVRGCHCHDNTGGLLVFNLPDLPVFGGQRAKVHDNLIEHNNLPTFAEPGTIVANVPPGMGMLLLAADNNEFADNVIRQNDSAGLLILSYIEALFGATDDSKFEPYSSGNFVHDNVFDDNGTNPDPVVGAIVTERPVPDVLFDGCQPMDGTGAKNCLKDNGDATYLDVDLCGTLGHTDPDISKVTCSYDPVPPQTF